MTHRRLWAAAAIIAAFVILSFLFSVPRVGDIKHELALRVEEPVPTPSVALRDAYKKGVHTITGALEAPDACSTVTAEASLQGDASSTARILVDVSVVSDAEVCLELPTRMNFSTTVAAPEGLPLSATVNGIPAETTPL